MYCISMGARIGVSGLAVGMRDGGRFGGLHARVDYLGEVSLSLFMKYC